MLRSCGSQIFGSQVQVIKLDSNLAENLCHFNFETERLKTFFNWPNTNVNPSDLAKSGFYYIKHNDTVRCHFCNIFVNYWGKNEVADETHQKLSPTCPLMKKSYLICNIPTALCDIIQSKTEFTTLSITAPESWNWHAGATKSQLPSDPKKGSAISTEMRLQTFQKLPSNGSGPTTGSWPLDERKEFVNLLVESGFYSNRFMDAVECYQCGLCICNWSEEDDEPDDIHSYFSPDCFHMFLKHGPQDSDYAKWKMAKLEKLQKDIAFSDDDLTKLMELEMCQHFLEKYSDYVVKFTFEKQLKESGIPFLTHNKFEEALMKYDSNIAVVGNATCRACGLNDVASIVVIPCFHYNICSTVGCIEKIYDCNWRCLVCGRYIVSFMKMIIDK